MAAPFFIVQQIHLTLKVQYIIGFGIAQNDVKGRILLLLNGWLRGYLR